MTYIEALNVESEPAQWTARNPWMRHLVSDGKVVLSVSHMLEGSYEIGLWRPSSGNPRRNTMTELYASVGPEDLDEYLADVEPLPEEFRPVPFMRMRKQ